MPRKGLVLVICCVFDQQLVILYHMLSGFPHCCLNSLIFGLAMQFSAIPTNPPQSMDVYWPIATLYDSLHGFLDALAITSN